MGRMTGKPYSECRKANAILGRYMHSSRGPVEHERARIDIKTVVENDSGMDSEAYRYFCDQLARIDRNKPVQDETAWLAAQGERPQKDDPTDII